MKKYNVTIKLKSGNGILYAGVDANSHKEAKQKVITDRALRGDVENIKALSSELIPNWNETHEKLYKHWIV